MFRGALLAGIVSMLAVSPAAISEAWAQSGFDASGQFTLSFKFGLPGGKEELPKLGFRVGASNVPTSQIDAADPSRRGLSLDFDRRDRTVQTFSGVAIQFGEADDKTIRLFNNLFSADSLGLTDNRAGTGDSGGLSSANTSAYGDIDSRQDRQDWLLGDSARGTDGWTTAPVKPE